MNVTAPPYYMTGSYRYFIDKPIRDKVVKQNHHTYYSKACARGIYRMLEFSEWFRNLSEDKLFQETANFWLLRYHYLKKDLHEFLKDKPPFRTLLSPDLTGTYRGVTLTFAGIIGWNEYEPISVKRTEKGVYLVDRLVRESHDGCGFGWEADYEVSLCDACLQPVLGTGKHREADGSAFEADLKTAEEWVRDWPIRDYTEYRERAKDMPKMMPPLFNITMHYLEHILPLSDYVAQYLDLAEPVYKRIACGIDKEEYVKSYRYEIEMMHDLSAACSAYQCGNDAVHEKIVDAYERYMGREIDTNRRKFDI